MFGFFPSFTPTSFPNTKLFLQCDQAGQTGGGVEHARQDREFLLFSGQRSCAATSAAAPADNNKPGESNRERERDRETMEVRHDGEMIFFFLKCCSSAVAAVEQLRASWPSPLEKLS